MAVITAHYFSILWIWEDTPQYEGDGCATEIDSPLQ
jgi:hypothetical protein